MTTKSMNEEEQRVADIAKHRISLKRKLRVTGCPVNNDDTTKRLEILVKFISE